MSFEVYSPASLEHDDRHQTPADPRMADVRDHLVAAQWSLMRLLERTEPSLSAAYEEELTGAIERIKRQPIEPLERWEGLSEDHHRAYRRTHNRVRFRRLLDYIMPGERVLDIGCGFGYVGGVLLHNSEAASYHGVDIGQHRIAAAENMRDANGFPGALCRFEVRGMFECDAPFMATVRPTLVLLLEVLEHVADPVSAIQQVARCLPRDCDLLFSVPFAGRLETVQGHVSYFNCDRLAHLLDQAGLQAQYVEPLHNLWTQVLCSRSAAPSPRLTELCRRTERCRPNRPLQDVDFSISTKAGSVPSASLNNPVFRPLRLRTRVEPCHRSRWVHRSQVELQVEGGSLLCSVQGGEDASGGQYGGVKVPIDGAAALKVDLTFQNPKNILTVCVDAYAEDGTRSARWRRKCDGKLPTEVKGLILRPGQRAGGGFVASPNSDLAIARGVEVFIRVKPGTAAAFRLENICVAADAPAPLSQPE